MNNIFIITCRFKPSMIKSIEKSIKKYPIANVHVENDCSDSTIIAKDSIAFFWLKNIPNPIKENMKIDDSYYSFQLGEKEKLLNTSLSPESFFKDNPTRVKQFFLEYLIRNFNKQQELKFTEEYVYFIHQLFDQSKNVPKNIFIYHHWLDKQFGFTSPPNGNTKKEFLSLLRKDVQRILENETNCENVQYNWLMHDADILEKHYSGLLWYDGIYNDNKCKTSYHTLSHDILDQYIPDDLKNDNIWCFSHQSGIDEYYENILLKMPDSPCSSANELYNYLVFDKELFKRRKELLEKFYLGKSKFSPEEMAFLTNTKINYLEKKIELINDVIGNGTIEYANDKYEIKKEI